jgi:hypothetical protein
MSQNARPTEGLLLLPRTTFGLEDLGLEQAEIDLAMSLMRKRHRGDIDELIRTAAFMGLHQMMAHEVETQRTWSQRVTPGLDGAIASNR